jgi:copper resistance protein B
VSLVPARKGTASFIAAGILLAISRVTVATEPEHGPAKHTHRAVSSESDRSAHAQHEPTQSEHATPSGAGTEEPPSGHVPPPPEHPMPPMSAHQMLDTMEMNDDATLAMFKLDRFERADTGDGPATSWNAEVWIGRDVDKLRLRSEGERAHGEFERADLEALWSHAIAPFWDSELGVRRDFGHGPDRSWAAFGVQGLAPWWIEVAATAYVGEGGRTAFRLESERDVMLTQRLILQPRLELNAYGRSDPAARVGAGVSDAEFGLRLRYEIRREFAPYVGVEWSRQFGRSADLARADGRDADDTRLVAGLRIWY